MVDARQEYESAKTMERQRKAEERDERLKSFKNYQALPASASDFHHHGIDALRAMIEHADPDAIETSGKHWRASADRLAGEDGRGGIRKAFMDAVDHATAHWEGKAADAFRREAHQVLEKIDRTYGHSRNVEQALIGTRATGEQAGVAHNLREAKKAMSKIKDPGFWDKVGDEKGDDSQFHKDMANPKMDARMALELNRDNLSLSKERQVEAVIVMEELAANYRARAHFNPGDGTPPGGGGDWPSPPAQTTPPPPVNMPTPGGTRPRPTTVTPSAPRVPGGSAVPPGLRGPNVKPSATPPVHTGLAGMQKGMPGLGGPSLLGRPGGGNGISGGSTSNEQPPLGLPGLPGGMPPGIGAPGPRGAGRTGVPAGGIKGGPGAKGGGRSGVPGMPGGGTGGGAGAGRGGAVKGGAQARTPGGVVGKPGGSTGGSKQGGSGLHRSRGGSQAGRPDQRGKGAGAPGMPGARGKGEGKERTTGKRPDYLVEDEETWTPQRNVAPRVIE
ncbi:hypothetical protein ACH4GK_01820 [Streptomyces rimosus]|uniref:hypothetical protein n=1 Tax=Streptomyces rimosus TaxID=1927 RepID=UPI0004C5736C|nr:hypothetical protein [Streptomyces rimosus]